MMNTRKLMVLAGIAGIVALLGGCFLQPELDATGSIRVDVASASASGVGSRSVIEKDDVDFVRFYLMNGSQYYNSATGEFENKPWAFQIDVSGGERTSVVVDGLPPGNRYRVLGAVGRLVDDTNFLQTFKYSEYGPFTVSAGNNPTQVNLRSNERESNYDYAELSSQVDSVVVLETVGDAQVWALADGKLYSYESGTFQEMTISGAAGFTPKTLSRGRTPAGRDVVWMNGTVGTGIYQINSVSGTTVQALRLGAVDSGGNAVITSSAAYQDGDDIFVLYKSTEGLGYATWKQGDTRPTDWSDLAEETGDDLPDAVDLAVVIQDYVLRGDSYSVVSTSDFGTVFLNEKTLDEIVDYDSGSDSDGSFLGTYENADGVTVYYLVDTGRFNVGDTVNTPDGVETHAVLIGTNALNIIGRFPDNDTVSEDYRGEVVLQSLGTISIPGNVRVRAVAGTDDMVLLGTDTGLYRLAVGEAEDGYAVPVGGVTAVGGVLERRIQRISINSEGTRAAILYGNGTVDIAEISGTGTAAIVTVQPDLQRPFYSGLPGDLEVVDGRGTLRSTITDMTWVEEDVLAIAGEYGLAVYGLTADAE